MNRNMGVNLAGGRAVLPGIVKTCLLERLDERRQVRIADGVIEG
jgi:hypothetical protein